MSSIKPQFQGSGGALFGIYLKTVLLSIVTLGIYAFWGKTNIRAYLYGATDLAGDRIAYHGTGGELFRGWIKAVGIALGVGIAAAMVGFALDMTFGALLFYGLMACWFFPLALVGSRAYRLSRTSWRGIRFSFRGELGECARTFVVGMVLTTVTLGIYFPYFHANMRRFLVNQSHLGDEAFAFTGNGGDLVGRWILAMVLTLLTLGIYWWWWAALQDRYYWSHTRLGDVSFRSEVAGGSLFGLVFLNTLLVGITLGIAYPWAKARIVRYYCERLHVTGIESLDTIHQQTRPGGTMGEGMADMLDVDFAGADFFGL